MSGRHGLSPVALTDEAAQNKRRKEQKLEAEGAAADLVAVLGTPQGIRFAARLLAMCHVYETSYTSNEQAAMAFREGERNVGLQLINNILRDAPSSWPAVQNETLRGAQ